MAQTAWFASYSQSPEKNDTTILVRSGQCIFGAPFFQDVSLHTAATADLTTPAEARLPTNVKSPADLFADFGVVWELFAKNTCSDARFPLYSAHLALFQAPISRSTLQLQEIWPHQSIRTGLSDKTTFPVLLRFLASSGSYPLKRGVFGLQKG